MAVAKGRISLVGETRTAGPGRLTTTTTDDLAEHGWSQAPLVLQPNARRASLQQKRQQGKASAISMQQIL